MLEIWGEDESIRKSLALASRWKVCGTRTPGLLYAMRKYILFMSDSEPKSAVRRPTFFIIRDAQPVIVCCRSVTLEGYPIRAFDFE